MGRGVIFDRKREFRGLISIDLFPWREVVIGKKFCCKMKTNDLNRSL
jgi:hypothetical protein